MISAQQDPLALRAQSNPDKIAIIDHLTATRSNQISYRQLHRQVDQMVARMQAAGIERGQHIGMLMMNSTLAIVPFFAALRLGLVLVPLNSRLTLAELDYQLRQSDCDYLLPYGTAEQLAGLRALGHSLANLPRKVKAPCSQAHPTIDPERPFLIVHTSGTSGKPKGAVLSYGNLYASAQASAARIGHHATDRWLCVLPLFHVGGLSIFVRATLHNMTVDLYPKFDVTQVNHALSHDPITLISLVPTMLYRLLESRQEAWQNHLRLILLGGAAATPDLIARCQRENLPIATTYGMTEAASQVATALPATVYAKGGTVGQPLHGTQVKIVAEDGTEQAPDQYGEILVKGATVIRSYYQQAEANTTAFQEGWFYTGDIGYRDATGDLWLVQRRSDLIITGGENVYPAEVEAVLRQHTAVAQVAVVGIPDAEWGQVVAAALVLHTNAQLTAEQVETYCRQHLAGYKVPRRIRFVESLPLTASGKIQRQAVQALFMTEA